jgi:hypothetical protein
MGRIPETRHALANVLDNWIATEVTYYTQGGVQSLWDQQGTVVPRNLRAHVSGTNQDRAQYFFFEYRNKFFNIGTVDYSTRKDNNETTTLDPLAD